MHVFVFSGVSDLTSSYHSDGGLVIVARDEVRAKELLAAMGPKDEDDWYAHAPNPTEEEWSAAIIYPTDPRVPERVFVFPNAGCC